MYDISFIMPVCDLTKHYFMRYMALKKYCFVNVGEHKLRIKLLVGPREDFYGQDITKGWPDFITPEIVETPYVDAAQKICYYHATMSPEEIMSARWHAKFDDDTANDISQLMYYLQEEFDYTENNYLVTELRTELHEIDVGILHEMGYGHWVHRERIQHEWEGCIVSQTAMLKIIQNEKAIEYLKRRMAIPGGFGDQPVGIALKFCKINAICPGFLCVWCCPGKFSLFGGPFCHIHFFLGRGDMNIKGQELYRTLLEGSQPSKMKSKIDDCTYSLNKRDCFEDMMYKFRSDNHLILDNPIYHDNGADKGIWTITKNNSLIFVNNDTASVIYEFWPTDESSDRLECDDMWLTVKHE